MKVIVFYNCVFRISPSGREYKYSKSFLKVSIDAIVIVDYNAIGVREKQREKIARNWDIAEIGCLTFK